MSDEKRPVPTGPGWWWMRDVDQPVRVVGYGAACCWFNEARNEFQHVTDDGRWIAPVLTPAEADALRERAERAEHAVVVLDAKRDEANDALADTRSERDRYREAVGRLRRMLSDVRSEVMRPETSAFKHYDIVPRLDYVLDATTDEAIQGYDAPPADAGLLAKANAALVAEVAELRADLAAERGEAEGALPGWRAWGSSPPTWCMGDLLRVALGPEGWRGISRSGALLSVGPLRSARAAMRAAEAEARRLGLIGSEP